MYVWSALVSFGVIVLGLVRSDRQWAVVAVVAGLRPGAAVVTLGRPVPRTSPDAAAIRAVTATGESATRRPPRPGALC